MEEEEQEIRNIKVEIEIWKYINKERKPKRRITNNTKMEELKNHFELQLEGHEERCRNDLN